MYRASCWTLQFRRVASVPRSKQTQVILAPRDGGTPRFAECEPFFHYHVNNAFEDGSDVVLDLVRYPDYDNVHRGFRDFVRSASTTPRRLSSYAGRLPDEITIEDLCRMAASSRSTTGAARRQAPLRLPRGPAGPTRPFDAIMKVDHDRGTSAALVRCATSRESRSSSRAADAAEDDGWLLSLVYSAKEHRSRLVILDARDVEPTRSRSRTFATTSRWDSTGRSPPGSPHDRRGPQHNPFIRTAGGR